VLTSSISDVSQLQTYGKGFNITTCTQQKVKLSIMSNVALGAQNSVAPIAGFITDKVGPKVRRRPLFVSFVVFIER